VATWVLAVATSLLALSGPVAVIVWMNARKQDRERRQREHETETEERLLAKVRSEYVSKSSTAGAAVLGVLAAVAAIAMWSDRKQK
jgi:hypothetical protein